MWQLADKSNRIRQDDLLPVRKLIVPGTVNTTETISEVVNDDYYIIQEGDSLSSIAFARYGDADLAAKIAEKNGIGVDDNIFVGQKILLPNIP